MFLSHLHVIRRNPSWPIEPSREHWSEFAQVGPLSGERSTGSTDGPSLSKPARLVSKSGKPQRCVCERCMLCVLV